MRLIIAAALIAPFVIVAAPAFAADPATEAARPESGARPDATEMRARLMAMDTDHDGKWSKAEWLAGGRKERGFAMMDADKDGLLTPAELKAGVEKMRAMRSAR